MVRFPDYTRRRKATVYRDGYNATEQLRHYGENIVNLLLARKTVGPTMLQKLYSRGRPVRPSVFSSGRKGSMSAHCSSVKSVDYAVLFMLRCLPDHF